MNRAEAERRLRLFERDRGERLVKLASHAALPVVLTPDLLHLLRINYFLDPPDVLPYGAEAELLLSPLCTEIDDGLYVMEADLRDVLLQRLVKDYRGGGRLRDVARLLWEYGQRGVPWDDRPGLLEAQQLTALSFIDSPRALAWLERAQADQGGVSAADQRWFVAMRRDLVRGATAVQEAEAETVYLPSSVPALVELRDVLATLYADPAAALGMAERMGISLAGVAEQATPAARWQALLDAAWLLNRVPAILKAATSDHPDAPSLARAIQEYWIRLSPALPVHGGVFEAAPAEWSLLEARRGHIQQSIRALMVLFVERSSGSGSGLGGLGVLAGQWVFLTHETGIRDYVEPDGDGGWRVAPGTKLWAEFADRHPQWPRGSTGAPTSPGSSSAAPDAPASHAGARLAVTHVHVDVTTGLALLGLAPPPAAEQDRRRPVRVATTAPPDSVGRRVYVLGYPFEDQRNDRSVLERILGGRFGALHVQPGTILSIAPGPIPNGTGTTTVVTHNCFTSGGNGGSPLIDLETGDVLAVHYGSRYLPGAEGLKQGSAAALWPLAAATVPASVDVFRPLEDRETTSAPSAPRPESAPALIDRAREQTTFLRMLEGERPERVLLIEGEAGVGKTALLRRYFQLATEKNIPVAMVDLGHFPVPVSSGRPVFERIAQELAPQALEANALPVEVAGNPRRDAQQLETWLWHALGRVGNRPRFVVLLDEVDAARDAQWLDGFVRMFGEGRVSELGILVLAGRDLDRFSSRRHSVERVRLRPLDPESIKAWLATIGLTAKPELVDWLVDSAGGTSSWLGKALSILKELRPRAAAGSSPSDAPPE